MEPLSVKHQFASEWNGKGTPPELTTCTANKHMDYNPAKNSKQEVTKGNIIFSYGVEFRSSEVKWASRWDVYLSMNHAVPDKVHWFSIINSILIVLFLAFMVGMILVRSLNKDISKYNRVSSYYY